MENLYLIVSSEKLLINEEITKITNQIDDKEYDQISYDLSIDSLDDLVEELTTNSLFAQTKVVIVNNINDCKFQENLTYKHFIGYFKNPNPDNIVIFTVDGEIENQNLKKQIKKHVYLIELDESVEVKYRYIKTKVVNSGFIINDNAVKYLFDLAGNDLNRINTEIEKLMVFTSDLKEITIEDIDLLVSDNSDNNIFELTNLFLTGDIGKAIKVYNKLVDNNVGPLYLLSLLSNRIRQLIMIKKYKRLMKNNNELLDLVKVTNPNVLYYLNKDANKVSLNKLEEAYKQCLTLDYKIKTGQIDKQIGLELLILGGV